MEWVAWVVILRLGKGVRVGVGVGLEGMMFLERRIGKGRRAL